MHQMHLVYDCRHAQAVPGFAYIFIVPVLIGISVFFYNLFNGGEKKVLGMVFGGFFALFGLSLSFTIISTKVSANAGAEQLYAGGKYKVTQGIVRNYHPAPSGGHKPETFDVDSVHFEIWDADLTTQGYNATAASGSVIQPNLYVKIAYAKSYDRNIILRLEAE
jgi:hypothetical protein